jgi:ComEC/Rec2-related protein
VEGVAAVVWILTMAVAAGVARRVSFLATLIAVLVGAALVRRRAAWLVFALIACAAAILGWRASGDYARDCAAVEHVTALAGAASVTLDGLVTGFPQAGLQGSAFEFTTVLDGRRVRLSVRAECFDAAYGDRYRLRARFVKVTPSMRGFIASRGVAGVVRVRARDAVLCGKGGNPLFRDVFWPLHRFARTRLTRAMGSDAGLAIGMLLGDRTQLPDNVRDAVRRLGITHLLAISGMHLTTVAGCVFLCTRLWPRGRAFILFAALTLYSGTVGNVESLTRAYVMAVILIATHAMIRPVRPIDALAKALLVMVVASPLCLRSVGLQLSFAATFAVLLFLPHAWHAAPATGNRARRWTLGALKSLCSAFLLSLAVEVFILPLQLHHFHALSAVGPVATVMFFIPVTVVLLGAAPVAVLAALAPAQEWPGHLLGWLSLATNRAILATGRWTPGPFAIPEPNAWLYYGALVLGWKCRRRPRLLGLAAGLVALSFVWRW